MIEIPSLSKLTGCKIMAKCEHLNPGGSVKDRVAKRIILEAERQGLIKPGDTIVEASGGNTGVALAIFGAARGYKIISVQCGAKVSKEKADELKLLGGVEVSCPVVPFTDPRHFFHTANKLAREGSNCIFTNQFDN